jgi:hypothetical protein
MSDINSLIDESQYRPVACSLIIALRIRLVSFIGQPDYLGVQLRDLASGVSPKIATYAPSNTRALTEPSGDASCNQQRKRYNPCGYLGTMQLY